MNHKRLGLVSYTAIVGLLLACSSKKSGDDSGSGGSGNAGGDASIVIGNAGTAGTGTNANTLPDATTTTDGTQAIDSATASAILEDPVKACQGWGVEAEAEKSVIYFLVDVSGSMLSTTAATNGLSKWSVTRTALKTAIAGLPSSFGVGVGFYPNMAISASNDARDTSACVNIANDVPLALATAEQQAKVVTALDGIEPNSTGATPTHDAFGLAVNALNDTTLTGKRYLVLITDGQPTQSQGCLGTGIMCNPSPTDPIISSISAALTDNAVQTFVVGSPGSEANVCTGADVRGWLSQAARAGNTAKAGCGDTAAPYCHFDLSQAADFGAALTAALSSINDSLISCTYDVPKPTAGTTLAVGNVSMVYDNGKGDYLLVLPNSTGDCSSDKGWSYTDATNTKVQICNTTCKLFQQNPNAGLSVLFGCAPEDFDPML